MILGSSSKVSVIIPVHNALPYLEPLLDSILSQQGASFDIIAVDDGSTDGSGAILDDYATRASHVRVVHQQRSGRPGGPRNVGLRLTTSRYVFFADADDLLAPRCLERLVAFADTHRSDVVIPKLTPFGGRGVPTAAYERTLPAADVETAFRSLFPQKLYRRQFLAAHDIWYPEGVRPDDGVFNANVYVRANRISILADDDYYFLRTREDGQPNLSNTAKDPLVYTRGLADMFRTVRAHLESERADRIVLDLYRRKCLKLYQGRFANESVAVQDAWIAAHGRLVREFIPEALEHRLESPYRERAHFVRQGDRTGLLALRATEAAPVISATVAAASWCPQGLDVAMDISVEGRMTLPRQLLCTLQPRGGDGLSGFPLVRATPDGSPYGRAARYEGGFPRALIDALLAGQYDVHVVSLSGAERLTGRVQWGASVPAIPARDGLAFYSTKGRHASIRKSG